MRAHSATVAVQEEACRALIYITVGTGTDAQGCARKQAAADAGVLPLLVAAMHAPSTTTALQWQARVALISITRGTDTQSSSRKQAAVDAGALLEIWQWQ
ncbi:hypothetical protein T492DRAFT_934319 [Pavlovales sp. CCMP2436]|nr:hypothetical protein T492DRAFT_934319 [Pavlovales sp. CCMP2436]